MGHSTTTGRPPARTRPHPASARRTLLASAGPAILPTYDLARGTPTERRFLELAEGLPEIVSDAWPHEGTLGEVAGTVLRDGQDVVAITPGVVANVSVHHGWVTVRAAANGRDAAESACAAFRQAYPASYLNTDDDGRVPITFWTLGPFGPIPHLRRIDAATWPDIEGNYTGAVRDELADLMAWRGGPQRDGQLFLWQGPPGTGKSWALRALASEWAPWAEFYYITDPDSFFVTDPSYMVQVLLTDSYAAIEPDTGDVYSEAGDDGKWRVLLLEDTGELLSSDAKERSGQGLSRLLNVVDGMLGQGLRVLAILTTNDEIESMHPAVIRPGRCASQVEFGPLTAAEASAWLGSTVEEGGTLAELYARRGDSLTASLLEHGNDALVARDCCLACGAKISAPSFAPGQSCPNCGAVARTRAWVRDDPLYGHGWDSLTAAGSGVAAEVAKVAAEHAPEGGYGETWYRASDRTVFWNAADWTGTDELEAAEAAFLAIDGVDRFLSDMEVGQPDGDGWGDPVWKPSSRLTDAALAEVVALAARPLELDDEMLAAAPSEVAGLIRGLVASGEAASADTLRAALEAVGQVQERSLTAIREALVASAPAPGTAGPDVVTLAALAALDSLARRPDPPAPRTPDVHVHVPKDRLEVNVAAPNVEAPKIDVHVQAPAAPPPADVHVHVPEQPAPQVTVAAPEVRVEVPAQAAPDVHVHVPKPDRPHAVRVETDPETGERRYVTE